MKISRYRLLVPILLFFVIILTPLSYAGTQKFVTMLPVPSGNFDRLRLVPRDPIGGTSCHIGTMYYDLTTRGIMFCRNEGIAPANGDGEWGPLPGVWVQSGNNVTLSDTTTPPLKSVAIGTQSPDAMLTLDIDGGIIAKGLVGTGRTITTFGPGSRFMWYPRRGALRAGGVANNDWDDTVANPNIGNYSVAFGFDTKAKGDHSTVTGGAQNQTLGLFTTISGGQGNLVVDQFSTVGGGENNDIAGSDSSQHSTIGGGKDNIIRVGSPLSTIAGGNSNEIFNGYQATIGGGVGNRAPGDSSVIAGGSGNHAVGQMSAIAGGWNNTTGTDEVASEGSFIGGGASNQANGKYSVVGGGLSNVATGDGSTISGGASNDTGGSYMTIGGGTENQAFGNYHTVSGGRINQITAGQSSVIAGGSENTITGGWNAILGGLRNKILNLGSFSSILGGSDNQIDSNFSMTGGKFMHLTSPAISTFAWGYADSTLLIDQPNTFLIFPQNTPTATQIGQWGRVGIGTTNPLQQMELSGPYVNDHTAFRVSNGRSSTALAMGAGGNRPFIDFMALGNRSLVIKAINNYTNIGGSPAFFRNIANPDDPANVIPIMTINKFGLGVGIPPDNNNHVIPTANDTVLIRGGGIGNTSNALKVTNGAGADLFFIRNDGNIGIQTAAPAQALHVIGNILASGTICGNNGSSCASDQRLKKNIQPLVGSLDKLLSLKGVSYEWDDASPYADQKGTKLGLIAQDVEKVFPQWVHTGTDGYKNVDLTGFEGVAVEALRELKNEIEALKSENAELKQRVAELEKS